MGIEGYRRVLAEKLLTSETPPNGKLVAIFEFEGGLSSEFADEKEEFSRLQENDSIFIHEYHEVEDIVKNFLKEKYKNYPLFVGE